MTSPDTSAAEVVANALIVVRAAREEIEIFERPSAQISIGLVSAVLRLVDVVDTSRAETAAANARAEAIKSALVAVVNSPALSGVRTMVAGWNGEDRDGGPYERHPSQLGAHISTNCGRIYALDESLVTARALLAEIEGKSK